MVHDRLEGMPSTGNYGIPSRMKGDTEGKRERLLPRLELLRCDVHISRMETYC